MFTLEVHDRSRRDPALRDAPPRLGLTVTKKIGNAVLRNRIRRRLREAVRTDIARDMRPGHDYVVVAKPEAATAPFDALARELRSRIAAPMRERGDAKGTGDRRGKRKRGPSGTPPNASATGAA